MNEIALFYVKKDEKWTIKIKNGRFTKLIAEWYNFIIKAKE